MNIKRTTRNALWGSVAVLLVATALRLAALGDVPPGLYHDEAYHGLDALDILRGQLSLYFPANNGREPMFLYLVALSVGLLGKSPYALRLVSVPVGILTVAATAAMGRALFSRRVGLLSAAVLAVTLWHVHLSRVSFRAILFPLFIALTTWQVAEGVKGAAAYGRKRWSHWVVAGILYGLGFYTYTAARFSPVALLALGLYLLATQPAMRDFRSRTGRSLWSSIGAAALAAFVAALPLGIYTASHLDTVLGRPGQVSICNPTINGGDFWGTLGTHTLRTLGMVFVRGDRIWRHNVPWRPVFDPVLGVAFLVGLGLALRRARRDPASGFALIWTAVMSLPTLLAEDAPHFLRAVGMLPVLTLFPALGMDWLATTLISRIPNLKPRVGYGVVFVCPLVFALASTTWAYFGNYARDPMAGYWFERGAAALAGRMNEFLGAGWDGEQMLHGDSEERQIYLDRVLWEEWQPQIRFLGSSPEAMRIGLEQEQVSDARVAVFAWPYGDSRRAWPLLPAPAEVTVEEGPLSQGDRDLEPFTTYLAFFSAPPDQASPALACFSGGVELLDVKVSSASAGRLRVRIRWRATASMMEDYTAFLHYLRDGERIAQADGQPAGGHYPTTVWRPGDVLNDDRFVDGFGEPLPGRDTLRLGLWNPESGAVLHLLDEAGNPAGDWIEVPVNGPQN
jgi:4-amino-4-deoxy-L-arabinose transferase-like glycosyltransferase